MEIINFMTQFGNTGGAGGFPQMNEATLIYTYGKDIEEMIKWVMISGKDVTTYFS